MIKRLTWMIILVLATAFSVVATSTGVGGEIFNLLPATATPGEVRIIILPEAGTATPATATPGEVRIIILPEPSITPLASATSKPTLTGTAVPGATKQPTATHLPPTPTKTKTPLPTATATKTKTPLPTATATPVPFQVQRMTPIYASNFVHTDAACKWQGVAGQVFDANGAPILNYIVKITSASNTKAVSLMGVTGMVSGLPYGPGSYEIVLGSTPVDSVNMLKIQLFDKLGNPITDSLTFNTFKDCSKNLAIINFQKK